MYNGEKIGNAREGSHILGGLIILLLVLGELRGGLGVWQGARVEGLDATNHYWVLSSPHPLLGGKNLWDTLEGTTQLPPFCGV